MARCSNSLSERNEYLVERYRFHRKKNPRWTVMAVIEEAAKEVWLSPATAGKILKKDGIKVPCVDTIAKYTRMSLNY